MKKYEQLVVTTLSMLCNEMKIENYVRLTETHIEADLTIKGSKIFIKMPFDYDYFEANLKKTNAWRETAVKLERDFLMFLISKLIVSPLDYSEISFLREITYLSKYYHGKETDEYKGLTELYNKLGNLL